MIGDYAMLVIKLIVFLAVSLAIAYVSRSSLRTPHFHGFYRFFAWEAILGLALINIDYWFIDPFGVWQILAWLLLFLSLFLVIHAVRRLRKVGKQDEKRDEAALYSFEKTSRLVTVGAFRYIRHPMYSSLLCLAWGIFCKHPALPGAALAVTATIFLVLTAKLEEKENTRYFGDAYIEYMRKTKMFVPFLF